MARLMWLSEEMLRQFSFLLLPRKCQVSSGMRFAMFRPATRRLRSLVARSGVGVRSIASSATAAKLFGSLRAPIIGAPLFIVSNPDLVIAQCKVCAWPVRGLCAARARRVRGACAARAWRLRTAPRRALLGVITR